MRISGFLSGWVVEGEKHSSVWDIIVPSGEVPHEFSYVNLKLRSLV